MSDIPSKEFVAGTLGSGTFYYVTCMDDIKKLGFDFFIRSGDIKERHFDFPGWYLFYVEEDPYRNYLYTQSLKDVKDGLLENILDLPKEHL